MLPFLVFSCRYPALEQIALQRKIRSPLGESGNFGNRFMVVINLDDTVPDFPEFKFSNSKVEKAGKALRTNVVISDENTERVHEVFRVVGVGIEDPFSLLLHDDINNVSKGHPGKSCSLCMSAQQIVTSHCIAMSRALVHYPADFIVELIIVSSFSSSVPR